MVVRRLAQGEIFAAQKISSIAFHIRVSDAEKERFREESEKDTTENWGAFAEDGTLMARIVNNRFETYLDGHVVRNGGIGAVSTLPEYRSSGAIREIFRGLLPSAYRGGEVLSTLYPFNHEFYRKAGYETVCWKNVYEMAPAVLARYRFSGRAARWDEGKSAEEFVRLYERFASGYNLSMRRAEAEMVKRRMEGDSYRDGQFCYMLYEGDRPVAYLVYRDVPAKEDPTLSVRDLAWLGREGFEAILGFLARFSADYGSIELPLPMGMELYSLLRGDRAYDVRKTTRQDYMVRVIDARKLLALIRKPEGSRFVVRVTDDEILPQNVGAWAVRGDAAEPTDDQPDLVVSCRALGQMAVGAVSLDEACYREDVRVLGNEKTLEKVFVRKPIFVQDHF